MIEVGIRGRVAHSDYAKAVGILTSGSLIAQLLTVAVAPIMTRLLTPSAIGVYTLVISATSLFGAVLSLRYDLAIVYDDDEANIPPLVVLSTALVICLSFLIALLYFLYFSLYPLEGFSSWWLAVSVFVLCLFLGAINILNSCNNRQRDYRAINIAGIERSVVQNGGIVLAGLAHLGAAGLVIAQTFGYLAGMARQLRPLAGTLKKLRFVQRGDVGRVARLHKKQALWSAPAVFANGVAFTAINYLIELLYGVSSVGFYSLSYRILGLPITVLGMNVSRVFTERAAQERREKGDFRNIFKKTFFIIAVVAAPVAIVLVFVAPSLVSFVFGEEWRVAGEYIQILTPMYVLRLISGALNGSTVIAGRQQRDAIIQLALVLCVAGSFTVAASFQLGLPVLLGLVSGTSSVVYIAYILIFWFASKCRN